MPITFTSIITIAAAALILQPVYAQVTLPIALPLPSSIAQSAG